MLWVAEYKLKAGEKNLRVSRIIDAEDMDKAIEIAEKKALINTYWDCPDAIWELDKVTSIDNREMMTVDDERDIKEDLIEIANIEDWQNLSEKELLQTIKNYIYS